MITKAQGAKYKDECSDCSPTTFNITVADMDSNIVCVKYIAYEATDNFNNKSFVREFVRQMNCAILQTENMPLNATINPRILSIKPLKA
jgi:hypothetical protein